MILIIKKFSLWDLFFLGVRPYKCPQCDYTAIQSGSFKNHMKQIHRNMEGMYVCNICCYKTVSEDNYVRHISDHLTGLIKDNGEKQAGLAKELDDGQQKASNRIQITASDFMTDLFGGVARLEEQEILTGDEYSDGNQILDDDVVGVHPVNVI